MKQLNELKRENYGTWKQAYENCCLGTDGVVTDDMIEEEFRKLLNELNTRTHTDCST